MKNAVLGILIFLGVSSAQSLNCVLQKDNQAAIKYAPQTLFSLEVLKGGVNQEVVLVKPDGSIIENFELSSLKTMEDFQALDKSIMAVIVKTADNSLAIGISGFEVAKTENITPMYAMAVGNVSHALAVSDGTHDLTLSCY